MSLVRSVSVADTASVPDINLTAINTDNLQEFSNKPIYLLGKRLKKQKNVNKKGKVLKKQKGKIAPEPIEASPRTIKDYSQIIYYFESKDGFRACSCYVCYDIYKDRVKFAEKSRYDRLPLAGGMM